MSLSEEKKQDVNSPYIFLEQTLAIIKPDAIHKADEIEEIILRHGFSILRKRRMQLTPEQTSEFYAEHYGKMFFPSLIAFMSSGPILAMILARDNAVTYWRQIIGPTQTSRARDEAPESVRALFGTDNQKNAVHGSDSTNSAVREIHFFFPNAVLDPLPNGQDAKDYLARSVNPTLQRGLAELCRQKPAEPILWLASWLLKNDPHKPKIANSTPLVEEIAD